MSGSSNNKSGSMLLLGRAPVEVIICNDFMIFFLSFLFCLNGWAWDGKGILWLTWVWVTWVRAGRTTSGTFVTTVPAAFLYAAGIFLRGNVSCSFFSWGVCYFLEGE